MLYCNLFLLLIALLLQQSWVADSQSLDCAGVCGDVVVHYPFGLIGTNCSIPNDDYFLVTCKNASSGHKPKAVLTKLNLELIQGQEFRSSSGIIYITVKIPVTRTCFDRTNRTATQTNEVGWSGLNLSGTPFIIDTSHNVFASVGCDGSAWLYNETGQKIGGCSSRCNPPGQVIDGCNGYYCCQSDLRSTTPFQRYTVRLNTSSSGGKAGRSCRAGFLTSRAFLQTNSSVTAAMDESAAVPVVLQYVDPDLHGFSPRDNFNPNLLILILILCVLTIFIASFSFWLCWLYITRKKRKEIRLKTKYFKSRLEEEWPSNMEVVEKTKLFSLKDLKKATNIFSKDRILGQGAQGTVYKGILRNGQFIAIKKSSKTFDEVQWKQFINEVILLSKVNNRNVVKLFGCCLETKAPMMVYELIPNGTLFEYMHNSKEMFTWEMRIRIACEVAGAISYLHSSLSTPIYHRDIKSTNILLDESYQAKVADFGISKVISIDKTHTTTGVQGTFGYFDPEYFQSSRYSEKSDVYSFGVILIELLTGQRPIRETTLEGEKSLVVYFISSMEASTLDAILDPTILEGSKTEEFMFVADLAKRCLKPRGIERPTMKEVAMELDGLRKRLSLTPSVARQASLEIQNVATRSTLEMGQALTVPVICKDISVMVGNCDDEETICRTSWYKSY